MMKILAIIPCRSGSKGLKDKNIKELCGKPLCAYTIEAAIEANCFEEVHFSTDSAEYAKIAEKYGAKVPFLRDSILATDTSSSWDVVKKVTQRYAEKGKVFDAVMILQATSPLRSSEDILNAIKLFKEKSANAIVSVAETEHSPYWSAELPEDGNMAVFHERVKNVYRRQEGAVSFSLNGALYLVKVPYLFECENIFQERCYAYVMPQERSFDIDTQFDFDLCSFLMSERLKKISKC